MVTKAELESQFKAISQDYEGTKKTLDQLREKVESMDEKLNSVDAKLKEFCTMREDKRKLEVTFLAKYPDRIEIYQQFTDSQLNQSLSPTFIGKN